MKLSSHSKTCPHNSTVEPGGKQWKHTDVHPFRVCLNPSRGPTQPHPFIDPRPESHQSSIASKRTSQYCPFPQSSPQFFSAPLFYKDDTYLPNNTPPATPLRPGSLLEPSPKVSHGSNHHPSRPLAPSLPSSKIPSPKGHKNARLPNPVSKIYTGRSCQKGIYGKLRKWGYSRQNDARPCPRITPLSSFGTQTRCYLTPLRSQT